MKDDGRPDDSTLPSTRSHEGSSVLQRLDPHCCKGQKSSCCSLHLHQRRVDRLSSAASLIAPPRAGPRQRTALLLCYRPVCSSNYQITSPHLAFSAAPHHAHTWSQEELQVLQKERMQLCMFSLTHSSGPCLQSCQHDPLPAGTVFTLTKPRCASALCGTAESEPRETLKKCVFCEAGVGIRNPSLPSWKVSSKKQSHASPRLP